MSNRVPIPAMEGLPLTIEEYHALTPERFELYEGYLFRPADRHEPRLKLLRALMENEGLLSVVKLAPRENWQEALNLTYAQNGS